MSKDYYKTLGVEKNASPDEIKTAFRKLAHQHHPDKQGGDEAKFKEINEAYQVLSNPDKRSKYDQFGSSFDQQGGFGQGMGWEDFMRAARQGGGSQNINFDFGDMGDMFGDIFGFASGGRGGRSQRGSRVRHGEDIHVELTIDFRDAVFGLERELNLPRTTVCSHCHGNQAEPGTPIETCQTCGGSGQIIQVQRTFIGNIQTAAICPGCNGEGKTSKKKCTACGGKGLQRENKNLSVKIPAGVDDGMTLRLREQGNAGMAGGRPGDLMISIRVKPDKRFDREAQDLFTDIEIPFTSAILGKTVEFETLDGKVDLEIQPGTQPNTKLRIRGRGVPSMDNGNRGDLYVNVVVTIPKKLSRKQKEMLESFDE